MDGFESVMMSFIFEILAFQWTVEQKVIDSGLFLRQYTKFRVVVIQCKYRIMS